jgi:chromosome segregation protein
LAREREWRELPASIAEEETRRKVFRNRLDENHRIQKEYQSALDELGRRQEDLQARQANIEREQGSLDRDVERANEAIQWQQDLLERLETERAEIAQNEERIRVEISDFQAAQVQAQERGRELAVQASALTAEALLAELSQAQTESAILKGRKDSQCAILNSHQANLTDYDTRIRAKEDRVQDLLNERQSLLGQLATQRDQASQLNDQIAAVLALIDPTETELSALEEQQRALETEESKGRTILHRLETEHSRLALEHSRRQDELEMLLRQIEDDLGLVEVDLSEDQIGQPYLPLHPLISLLPVVEELPEGVENDVRRFKVQLSRLGSVNPDAPQEYEELHNRHEFLTQQMADLEQAAADLRQVIAELDRLMEREFSATFEAVANEFKSYFERLFDGGEAQLVLTDPENLTDTGVDIIARPPGKRLQSLSMLSGGERALTAVALVFALLKVSPTPFCALDEVDAMLDEANVGRFRQELEKLAQETQFILITHNRRTIEAANTIYGISMGEDSVSRAISLKLDEVEGQNA